jgi:predicted transcriptional regulator
MTASEIRILGELTAIKKLLLLRLLSDGMNATDIGKALGITSARVGQLVPVRKLKKDKRI